MQDFKKKICKGQAVEYYYYYLDDLYNPFKEKQTHIEWTLFLCPVLYTPYFITSSHSPYEVGFAIPISQMKRMNQETFRILPVTINGWAMIQTWVFLTSASELVSPLPTPKLCFSWNGRWQSYSQEHGRQRIFLRSQPFLLVSFVPWSVPNLKAICLVKNKPRVTHTHGEWDTGQ